MPKRKFFSRKDGTTFFEDVRDASEDVKDFLQRVPVRIRELLPEAEDVVIALEDVAEQIREGGDMDIIIDEVLARIPGTQQEAIYEKAREVFTALVVKLRIAFEKAESVGGIKRDAAIAMIQSLNGGEPSINEAALATEMIIFAQRS